jgi:ribose/xylose/arabinose/galactoside ABC-type transport system permease subunit
MSKASTPLGEALVQKVLVANKAALFALIFAIGLFIATPYFMTQSNLFSLADQIVVMTIVALGYTFLLGSGEIDLSITGTIPLIGAVVAKLMVEASWPVWAAILAGLVLGAACGAFNAAVTTLFGLPSFIVTLATGAIFLGVTYIITNLVPVSGLPEGFVAIGRDKVGPVSVLFLVLIPIAAVFVLISKKTVFARHAVAMATNPAAVRAAGISAGWVRLKVFVLVGVCCAGGSILLTSRSASAQIGAGAQLLLLVIAAVVIGGTPLMGGKLVMVGTLFGCLTIGMISNGLNLLGVNANYQVITQGVLILVALLVDVNSTRLADRLAKRRLMRERKAQ